MNYDKLRQAVDVEVDDVVLIYAGTPGWVLREVVAAPRPDGEWVVRDVKTRNLFFEKLHRMKQPPLFWLEDDPIYEGDTVYCGEMKLRVTGFNPDMGCAYSGCSSFPTDQLTLKSVRQPLCEIEGRPVFKGDVLYCYNSVVREVEAEAVTTSGHLLARGTYYAKDSRQWPISELSWTPFETVTLWFRVFYDGSLGQALRNKPEFVSSHVKCVIETTARVPKDVAALIDQRSLVE